MEYMSQLKSLTFLDLSSIYYEVIDNMVKEKIQKDEFFRSFKKLNFYI